MIPYVLKNLTHRLSKFLWIFRVGSEGPLTYDRCSGWHQSILFQD